MAQLDRWDKNEDFQGGSGQMSKKKRSRSNLDNKNK